MSHKRLQESGLHLQTKPKHINKKNKKKTVWIVVLSIFGALVLACGLYLLIGVHAPDADVEEIDSRTEGIYTFLLIGTDKGGGNTDTIMVATFDATNQRCSLVSIPRDTMVNVKWDVKKINSVYSVKGVDGLKEHVEKLLGFMPDHYVKIKLQAFVDVVDAMGGVTFDVPRAMDYDDPAQDLHIHLKKGTQKLNGTQAMGLVRWRHNNDYTKGYSTIERDKTQQAFLKTMAKQCLSAKNWDKISSYVKIFSQNVESDLSLGEMLWLAKAGMNLEDENINMFTLPGIKSTSYWSRNYHNYQSYILADADENVKLVNEYFNPYDTPITKSMLDVVFINADGSLSTTSGKLADSRAATPPVVTREITEKELAETDVLPNELTKPLDEKTEEKEDPDHESPSSEEEETSEEHEENENTDKTTDEPEDDAGGPTDEKPENPQNKPENKAETKTKSEKTEKNGKDKL